MLLPETDTQPRTIPVELQTRFLEDGDHWVCPILEPFLGDGGIGNICSEFLPGQPMAHLSQRLHLQRRDAFLRDGSQENRCVATLFSTWWNDESLADAYAGLWRGPLVAMKSQPIPTLGPMDPDYVDLETIDLHDVLELLRQYGLASMSSHLNS